MNGPYAAAAGTYWNAGWRGVLPLPPRAKKLPPAGFTGENGIDPSYPDLHAWAESGEGTGNIALRLPRNIIGLDVDNYGDKHGAKTLNDAENRWGPLPATWRTTSRDDGASGIRLYRVPEGLAWPGELGPATEIIQHRHRYAIVWPSIHPEGRTYRWINPDGVTSTGVPDPDQLPPLPELWIEGLTGGELATSTARNSLTNAQTSQWLVLRPGAADQPCARMRRAIEVTLHDLRVASAHCAARDGSLRVIRLSDEGHSGLAAALAQIRQAFVAEATSPARDAQGKHRRSVGEAEREWNDLVTSGTNLVTANPTGTLTCDCAGQLTGLVVGNTPITDGTSALAPLPTPQTVADTDETERTSWWPRNLELVLAGRDDEPAPDILARTDGACLFYRGKVNGILGESESGKTWLALLAAHQTLTGGGGVVYLDFEDTPGGIISRLRALATTDDNLARLHYIGPDETLHATASGDLREALDLTRPDLIILDGFNAAMTLLGLDINDNGDATKFAQMLLRPLSQTGSAVVYVDHVPKNKDHRGKGGIGAQAKRAMTTGCAVAVDVLAPFGRGMTGKLALTVDKDRAGHVRAAAAGARNIGTAVLTSETGTGAVRVIVEAPNTAESAEKERVARWELMERISGYLYLQPEPVSQNEVAKAVDGRREKVPEALAELVKLGCVEVSEGPRHSRLHGHVKPFTVADALSSPLVPTGSDRFPSETGTSENDDWSTGSHWFPTGSGTSAKTGPRLVPTAPPPVGGGRTCRTVGAHQIDPDTGEILGTSQPGGEPG